MQLAEEGVSARVPILQMRTLSLGEVTQSARGSTVAEPGSEPSPCEGALRPPESWTGLRHRLAWPGWLYAVTLWREGGRGLVSGLLWEQCQGQRSRFAIPLTTGQVGMFEA